MLDYVPAQFRVRLIRRPRYGCRACENAVVQAAAPDRPIDGGMATEALIAQVLIGKYSDHLPLYRQSQIFARQGIDLDRSTLCDWVEVVPVGGSFHPASGIGRVAPRRINRNGFFAERVKSQAIRDYAFPQTSLGKSGPTGQPECLLPRASNPIDPRFAVAAVCYGPGQHRQFFVEVRALSA
jgi:hypothetical protein